MIENKDVVMGRAMGLQIQLYRTHTNREFKTQVNQPLLGVTSYNAVTVSFGSLGYFRKPIKTSDLSTET